ncbi:cell adhesion molecule Dscam2-like [Tachypleus tridentatus]|uniref:cell adhesion molecule Dscam2-like n=1 Tax=Tachypleus tridentatus TaxID=6853 RepID=UPI003FD16A0D
MRPLSTNGGIRHSEERAIRLRFLTNEDEGIYQCFVANDVDSAQGSRVLMLKSVKPRFLETFREEIIYPSSDISLKCVAQGQPLPKVTWTLNKQVIPESRRIRQGDFVTEKDTVHSYVNITQAEIGDGGDFTCIAENDGGRVASTAPVKIHGPPTALPPRERTVLAGTSEHFKCPVAGYPLVNFSWKKGDDVLPSSSRHTLKDTGEFVLRAAHKSVDEGTYVCTAWGPNGHSADGVVNLRVAVAPEVDPLSFPGSLEEGRRTSLQCMVSAGDVPILIQWTKDGKPLNPTSLEIKVKSFNQYASTLFFEKLSQQHSGNYTCTASNPLATDSRTAELTVRVEPRWSVQPTDGAVVLGGQTLFDCQAEGYPQPVLRWKKSSEVKDKQTFTQVMSNAKQQVLENGSLVIVDVAPNDSGEYLCQAYNGVGPGLSKVVTLSVYVPPRFDDDFDIRMVIKGGTVTLVCQPQGDGPLTVTWVTKDQPITSSFPR